MGAEPTVRSLPLPGDLKTVEVNGGTLAYREQGVGHPVVFVHGAISDLTIWEPQLPIVGAGYRAIAYSRRYAWPNESLPRGQTDNMERHVEDLLALLRALDAAPAHLVGNSLGAVICLGAAIREPHAVRSLVLEEPPLFVLVTGAPPRPGSILGSLVRHPLVTLSVMPVLGGMRPLSKMISTGDLDASVLSFARAVLGDAAFDRLPDEVRTHILANGSQFLGIFLAGIEPMSAAEIRSIKSPALVVTGAQSVQFLRRVASLVGTLLQEHRFLDVPSATHFMHLQNSAAFNAGLLGFLSDVDR
jgi:pimeloyl-ACP methyl ester carboxylesterase